VLIDNAFNRPSCVIAWAGDLCRHFKIGAKYWPHAIRIGVDATLRLLFAGPTQKAPDLAKVSEGYEFTPVTASTSMIEEMADASPTAVHAARLTNCKGT